MGFFFLLNRLWAIAGIVDFIYVNVMMGAICQDVDLGNEADILAKDRCSRMSNHSFEYERTDFRLKIIDALNFFKNIFKNILLIISVLPPPFKVAQKRLD